MLLVFNIVVKIKQINLDYVENGKISVVDAGVWSRNLKFMYFSERNIAPFIEAQKEFDVLSQKRNNVIFWGSDGRDMNFANDKWTVSFEWYMTSDNARSAAFNDLKKYVVKNFPAVIDMDKRRETWEYLKSLGYKKAERQNCIVYTR